MPAYDQSIYKYDLFNALLNLNIVHVYIINNFKVINFSMINTFRDNPVSKHKMYSKPISLIKICNTFSALYRLDVFDKSNNMTRKQTENVKIENISLNHDCTLINKILHVSVLHTSYFFY